MDDYEIATKLICVGEDGASVMQVNCNGLCVRLHTLAVPYMILIHCMVHRMNLAYRIIGTFISVSKVEDLIHDLHAYIARSRKRYKEFKNFFVEITDGNKLLKDVDTRWILLYEPVKRVLIEYLRSTSYMYKHHNVVHKAKDLLFHLIDFQILLTLCRIIPMLEKINTLMKHSQ